MYDIRYSKTTLPYFLHSCILIQAKYFVSTFLFNVDLLKTKSTCQINDKCFHHIIYKRNAN